VSRILAPGRNCLHKVDVSEAGLLVDARDYYVSLYANLLRAERYALIAGWQFDSQVELLRGDDAAGAAYPVELRALLTALCRDKPELRIYILAWDYSAVFALEREWMQRLVFDWTTPDAISFRFDGLHAAGASHHVKLTIVDGRIAFTGGVDLARSRWDDRRHAVDNAYRREKDVPQKPYHDTMAYATGPVVRELEALFAARWRRVTGEELELREASPYRPVVERALPIRCNSVAIARTYRAENETECSVFEIRTLYEDGVLAAKQCVYIETQYFTSRALHDALVQRMRAGSAEQLQIVIVMPRGADTPKEGIAIGPAQDEVLSSLESVAAETGVELRILFSASRDAEGELVPTFIHSKLLIVDNQLLTVGSANFTNRSLTLDTELNFAWECGDADSDLASDIARARGSLLAEHAGVPESDELQRLDGLVARLDALIQSNGSKLQIRHLSEESRVSEGRALRLERIFDPDKPLTELELDEVLAD
jgi:phospholipase D1/2